MISRGDEVHLHQGPLAPHLDVVEQTVRHERRERVVVPLDDLAHDGGRVEGGRLVIGVALDVDVGPVVLAGDDAEAHLGDGFGQLGHRVMRVHELQVDRLAGTDVRWDSRARELPGDLLGDARRHHREHPRRSAEEDALGAVGVDARRPHAAHAGVDRAALVVPVTHHGDRVVHDRLRRRVVDEHHVASRVDERGTADEHPVGVANRVDVGPVHEVFPLRDSAQQEAHPGAHGVLADHLGVDEQHDEHDVGLHRARRAHKGLGIARRASVCGSEQATLTRARGSVEVTGIRARVGGPVCSASRGPPSCPASGRAPAST